MLGSIEGVLLKKWGKEGKERAQDSGKKIFLEVITVCKSRMQCFFGSPTQELFRVLCSQTSRLKTETISHSLAFQRPLLNHLRTQKQTHTVQPSRELRWKKNQGSFLTSNQEFCQEKCQASCNESHKWPLSVDFLEPRNPKPWLFG